MNGSQPITVKELREILADLPGDYMVSVNNEMSLAPEYEVDEEHKYIDFEGWYS